MNIIERSMLKTSLETFLVKKGKTFVRLSVWALEKHVALALKIFARKCENKKVWLNKDCQVITMSYSITTRNVDGKCCWVRTLVMYLWLFPKGRQLQENKNFLSFHLNSCLEIFTVIRNNGVKIVCTILFDNAFIN